MTPASDPAEDRRHMARALELARRGEGGVEPNPMVGCVLVRDGQVLGEAWHQQFGGPHAEVLALEAAGAAARNATAYVTLEPCCHTGKTPPCTAALIAAGVARVVVGAIDPNPQVSGGGLEELARAGLDVQLGVMSDEATQLLSPFAKLVLRRRPWVIAKWAMTLDGKLATRTGESQWISGEAARRIVHRLRGRVDAVLVGRGTVVADDPRLTARPQGPRLATRIVLDSHASISPGSQIVRTARDCPVLVAVVADAPSDRCDALRRHGAEVWRASSSGRGVSIDELLDELGRRQMTNVLVEGGARALGAFFDAQAIDEVHAFVAPCLVGGAALTPIAGEGLASMAAAMRLVDCHIERIADDAYIRGRITAR